MKHIVVIGAGQAGSSMVAKLRALGFKGALTLIGDEPALPYQRPPLSKKYLLGEMDLDRLFLRPATFYDDLNISLKLGQAVTAIDRDQKTIMLGGKVLPYDQLVLATGSDPIRLPAAMGGALSGVYAVRRIADVDAMQPEFQPGRRVLIVGGGYIGLEAAAVAAKLGLKVTVVEMAARILQRVAAPETSAFFRDLHRSHGVEIIEGTGLRAFQGQDCINGATLADERHLDVDFAIVGVGIRPATHLAEQAGLKIDNGIRTNARGQTSDAHIWAAGDCASFPLGGAQARIESVPHAIDHAECLAENLMGAERDYRAKPWFWSDQYDVKLQIAGLNQGYDDVVVRKGEKSTSHWYYAGEKLLAVDAMNDPRAYMIGKRLIEGGKSADKRSVADAGHDLKSLLG